MIWIEFYHSLPLLDAVALSLVLFLGQGALIAIGLAALLATISPRFAVARYYLACAALVAMAICPVLTTWSLLRQTDPPVGRAQVPLESGMYSPSEHQLEPSTFLLPQATSAPVDSGSALDGAVGNVHFAHSWALRLQPWLPTFAGGWLFGVFLLSCLHFGAWRRLRVIQRRHSHPADSDWQLTMAALVRQTGLKRAVDLLICDRITVPMVVGWLRPVVLVPASAMVGLPPGQLESLVIHELAHIRRHDPWANLLQVALETLLFYHPAVWWASGQVRNLREHCCDDIAVSVCGDRLTYLRALADLEGLRSAISGSPRLAPGADDGSLLERIRRLTGASPAPDLC